MAVASVSRFWPLPRVARGRALAVLLLLSLSPSIAHPGHQEPSMLEASAPIDTMLSIHIALQVLVWGVMFPLGMVLGIVRSRWHVPLQSAGYLLTTASYILGHSHKGRQFPPSAHGALAGIVMLVLALQLVFGVYLKLHIHEGTRFRTVVVMAHGIVGKIIFPIVGWVQGLFGAILLGGYCQGGRLGQCLAHYIMGSAFIAYACFAAVLFLAGETWARRSGRSVDFWDSATVTAWGIVNTFTEHRGSVWHVKDMQHTMMGVVWWAGGILGLILSRNGQRTVVPALILIVTGWAMSDHEQELMISTKVHAMFGRTLILAGLARIMDVVYFAPRFAPLRKNDPAHYPSSDHMDGAAYALLRNANVAHTVFDADANMVNSTTIGRRPGSSASDHGSEHSDSEDSTLAEGVPRRDNRRRRERVFLEQNRRLEEARRRTGEEAKREKEEEKKAKVAASIAWRHLTPFLLTCSGLLFMSATNEELQYAHSLGMDHVTYILIMFSLAFLLYAWFVFLIHVYHTSGRNATPSTSTASGESSMRERDAGEYELALAPVLSTPRAAEGEQGAIALRLSTGSDLLPNTKWSADANRGGEVNHVLGEDDGDDSDDGDEGQRRGLYQGAERSSL